MKSLLYISGGYICLFAVAYSCIWKKYLNCVEEPLNKTII